MKEGQAARPGSSAPDLGCRGAGAGHAALPSFPSSAQDEKGEGRGEPLPKCPGASQVLTAQLMKRGQRTGSETSTCLPSPSYETVSPFSKNILIVDFKLTNTTSSIPARKSQETLLLQR